MPRNTKGRPTRPSGREDRRVNATGFIQTVRAAQLGVSSIAIEGNRRQEQQHEAGERR